tara:strand:+ start:39 stop:263 length:225 start_codon:yes stop_codon:yes gene_type:complete
MARQMKTRLLCLFFLTFLASCSARSKAETAFRDKYAITDITSTEYALALFRVEKKHLIHWYKNNQQGHPWEYAK